MNKKTRIMLFIVAIVLVIGSCVFMFDISPIKLETGNREMPEADSRTDELLTNIVIEQKFINTTENIKEVAVVFSRLYYLDEECNIYIDLLDGEKLLANLTIDANDIQSDHRTYLYPKKVLSRLVGKELTLRIYTESTAGTGLCIMTRDSVKNLSYYYGNDLKNGTLCFSITGE